MTKASDIILYGFQVSTSVNVARLMTTLSLTARIREWRARMQCLPSAAAVMAAVGPHIDTPLEHARGWVANHRPGY